MEDPAPDKLSAQEKLQQMAFWGFFLTYLAPVYLSAVAFSVSDNFKTPVGFTRWVVWVLANQEDILGYIYRLATAAIAISIPFSVKSFSWRTLASFFFILLLTLVLSALLGAYLRRGDVQTNMNTVADIFYFSEADLASEPARLAVVTRNISSMVSYFSQVQQTIILIVGTMTGIKISQAGK